MAIAARRRRASAADEGGHVTAPDKRSPADWYAEGRIHSISKDSLVRSLGGVPLFGGLSKQDLRAVAALAELRQYADGVAVVRLGGHDGGMHVVLGGSGLVRPAAGPERSLEAGGYFGELALVDGAPRAATVVAVGHLTTALIGGAGFRRMLREEPLVAVGLLPGFVSLIRELQSRAPAEGAAHAPETATIAGRAYDPDSGLVDGSLITDERELLGWRAALERVPLFSALPERHVRRVERQFAVRRYGTDRVLIRQGAGGGSFFLLLDGRVQVTARDGSTGVLEPGAHFGELALIDGAPRAATVTSLDQVTAAVLPRAAFQRLLKSEPRTAIPLIDGLVSLIRGLQGTATG
jgi:CRP-like cAMP-binding protein